MTNLYGSLTLPSVIKLNILQTIDRLKQEQSVNRNIYIQDMLNITYPTRTLPDVDSLSRNVDNKFSALTTANNTVDTINDSLNKLRSLLNTHIYSRIMALRYNVIGGIKAFGTQSINTFYSSKNTFNALCYTAKQRTLELFRKASNLKSNLGQIVDVTTNVDVTNKPVAPSRSPIDDANNTITRLLNMNKDLQYRLSFLYNSFKQSEKNLKIALSTRDYSAILLNPVKNQMKLVSNAAKTALFSSALAIKNTIVVSAITRYGAAKQALNDVKGLLSNKLNEYANYITTSRLDIYDKDGSLKSLRTTLQTLRADRTRIESDIISFKIQESIVKQNIKDGYNYENNLDKLTNIRNKLKELETNLNDKNNKIRDEQTNIDRTKKEIEALKKLKVNDPSITKYLGPTVAGVVGLAVLGSIPGLFTTPINPLQGPPQGQPNGNNPNDDIPSLDNGRADGIKDGNSLGYANGERDGLAEAQRQYKKWKTENTDLTGIEEAPEEAAEEVEEETDEEVDEGTDEETDEETDEGGEEDATDDSEKK
jgi:hypothetical protein